MSVTAEQLKWAFEVERCAKDFEYLCNTYLHIKSKTVIGFPTLKLNTVQKYLWSKIQDQWRREGYVRQIWGKSRQVGSCLDPSTQILNENLIWTSLGDVKVGDRVIAVDEVTPIQSAGQSRKFRTAVVEAVAEVYEPAFKLVMENGVEIIATGPHRFLSRDGFSANMHPKSRWREVQRLNKPYNGFSGEHRLRFVVNPWSPGGEYEDGWMGGILDGEGCFRYKRSGAEVNITQADGAVWERIRRYLERNNYTAHFTQDARLPGESSKLGSKILNRVHITRMAEIFKLFGQTRPSRFMQHEWWDNKSLGGCGYEEVRSWPAVKAIIPLGNRVMLDIQTSTGTFLANGLVSHNSTLVHALNFWRTNFYSYHNSFIIAHDEPSAYEQFDKIKTFYDALPDPLKSVTKYWAKGKIDFEDSRSRILCGHARNVNVGAGDMNHFLHMTEAARYPNADQVQAAIFPSISEAKGDDPSFIIIESTSVYGGDWYKAFAEDAMAGLNGFEFHFIPYYMHDDYKRPLPHDFRLTEEERQLLRLYPLMVPENVNWRRHKRYEYNQNPVMFDSEYPLSWEQSWVLPHGTSMTFDPQRLDELSSSIHPGKRAFVSSKGLEYSVGGHLEVWEEPVDGCFYDVGIDIAGGRTNTADWTVLEVVRRDTLEQVAEARGHWDPAGEEFLDLCYWTGMIYNRGQMIPDITGGWGHALLSDLQRRDYPNLWQWRRRDDAKERVSNRVGFLYTHRDKALLVNNAIRVIMRETPKIHSDQLMDELRHFITIGIDEEWGGAPGHFDDLVNSWSLALMGAIDEGRRGAPEMKPVPKVYKEKCYFHDVEADLNPITNLSGDFVARHSR